MADSTWQALESHRDQHALESISDLFLSEPGRAQRYRTQLGPLLLDYSKNRVNDTTLHLLGRLASASRIAEARDALFPLTDILVLNESEMAFYAGIEALPEDVEDITTLARALISHREQVIVLTCGAAGALAITWNGLDFTPARLTKVRDTTGSGDCFCGALCARLAEGDALNQAIQFASVAASLSVERDGAASAMPAREDIELAMFEMTAAEMPG